MEVHHPLMHGELLAIYTLFNNGFDGDVSKLSLYTTVEPCPMCACYLLGDDSKSGLWLFYRIFA